MTVAEARTLALGTAPEAGAGASTKAVVRRSKVDVAAAPPAVH